jgi:predicted NBD/HSP70 family sugar kinase
MMLINPKSTDILSKGIKSIWKSDVFVAREAAAAGYGERDIGKKIFVEDVIYMHSDIGTGAIIKKEMISEASGQSREESGTYLKPWNQFSVVRSSKELIEKGIGTDIVQMVGGDLDKVSLEIILKAAEKKDELAEDLVKRSALALGVRVAYLVNMFNAENVILGGGTERKEGNFIKSVQESAKRFILKGVVDKVKIIPGVLGKKASSIGAACLCRRELFMEA